MLRLLLTIFILTLTNTLCIAQEKTLILKSIIPSDQKFIDTISKRLNRKNEINYKSIAKELNKEYSNFNIITADTNSIQKKYIINLNIVKSIDIIIKNKDLKFIPDNIDLKKGNKITSKLNYVETLLQKVSKKIKEDGHVFFEVKLKDIKIKESTYKCILDITLNERKKRILDKIIIKGYENFPRKFISNYLKIKKGEPINIESLNEKTSNLKTLEFANSRKTPDLLFKKDSSIVYLYIDKKNRNSFDGVIGFNSDENDGKLEFTGYLNLNLLNNFNTGENIKLNYRSDENKQRLIKLNIENPLIFNTVINSKMEVSLFTKDSTFTNTRFSEELNTSIGKKNTLGIGFLNETSKIINRTDNNNLSDYQINNLFLTYNYVNKRYKTSNKESIFNVHIKNSFGKKQILERKSNRINIELEAIKSIILNNRNSLMIRNQNKKIIGQQVTQNELYRFGGINSIRGFDENSIEAETLIVLNLEYIYSINKNLNFNTVTDFGYFENKLLNQKEKLFSLGLGLSTKTKSGLLNIIFATGKSENEQLKFSNTKIHLSLKTFF